jgi:hypothetical protein
MINTEQKPGFPLNTDKKYKSLRTIVNEARRGAERVTRPINTRTPSAQPHVSFKESRTVSPIPRGKPDKPMVAPALEYSGFSKTSTKKYG